MVGYAFCGSFCTLGRSLRAMEALAARGVELLPIFSERTYSTDTRFYSADELKREAERIAGRAAVHTVAETELFGSHAPLDALIISPCTGNTLAKLAGGITDTSVTMAAKAHLRSDRPLLIALATNDGMSRNLANIGSLLSHKNIYFLPMKQDDPEGKPHSLVAELSYLTDAYLAMLEGRQLRPIFL